MSHPESVPPKSRCTLCLTIVLVGLLLLVVVSGWVVMVVQKVFNGAGMEHCCSIEGVAFNYLAMFVLLCGVAAMLLFAIALHVRDLRVRRDFERKYGVKVPGTTGAPPSNRDPDYGPSLHGYDHHDGD